MPDEAPFHLGHVHLKVRDLDRALEFYQAILDLQVTERHANYAFLTWGDHHHDVALQAVGEGASVSDASSGRGVGLYHAAVEVESADELRDVFEHLQERDVDVSPVDHGISKALYFSDPSGNGLEVYLDTRDARAQEEWAGTNRRFDPMEL